MKFIALQPFVPSGPDFETSKQLFQELGFSIEWDGGDYVGFKREECKFILQKFDNKEFAENFMISVSVSSVDEYWKEVTENEVAKKFPVKIGTPSNKPYGRELNIIDIAGVCWHFVE
jgi:hypothetical protein